MRGREIEKVQLVSVGVVEIKDPLLYNESAKVTGLCFFFFFAKYLLISRSYVFTSKRGRDSGRRRLCQFISECQVITCRAYIRSLYPYYKYFY